MHRTVHKFLCVENNLDNMWIIYVEKKSTFQIVENHTDFHMFCTQNSQCQIGRSILILLFFSGFFFFNRIFHRIHTVIIIIVYEVHIFILLIIKIEHVNNAGKIRELDHSGFQHIRAIYRYKNKTPDFHRSLGHIFKIYLSMSLR